MLTGMGKLGIAAVFLAGGWITGGGALQAQAETPCIAPVEAHVLQHARARKAKQQAERERKANQQAERMRKAKQQAERERKAKQQAKRKRAARQ